MSHHLVMLASDDAPVEAWAHSVAAAAPGLQVSVAHDRAEALRLAKEAAAKDTVEITSGGERFRILRKCHADIPPLEQKQGEPGHVAACWVTK